MRFNVLTAEFLPDWVKVIPTGPTHPCDQTVTLSPPLAGATGGAAGAPGTPHQQRRRALRHLRKEPLASAQPRRRADETPRDCRGGSASSASALRRGAAPGAEAHPQGEGAAPQEQETPLAEEGWPQRLALTCGLADHRLDPPGACPAGHAHCQPHSSRPSGRPGPRRTGERGRE